MREIRAVREQCAVSVDPVPALDTTARLLPCKDSKQVFPLQTPPLPVRGTPSASAVAREIFYRASRWKAPIEQPISGAACPRCLPPAACRRSLKSGYSGSMTRSSLSSRFSSSAANGELPCAGRKARRDGRGSCAAPISTPPRALLAPSRLRSAHRCADLAGEVHAQVRHRR